MKCLSARLLAASMVLLAAAGLGRADYLNWSYHWSVNTPVLASGTGSVAVAVVPNGNAADTIPVANLTTTSSATSANPDVYNTSYHLTLTLSDTASNTSGSLTWDTSLRGNLTATSSSVHNIFAWAGAPNALTQTLTLGHNQYQVTLQPSTATLTAPGSSTPVLLTASVSVSPTVGISGNSPEPVSLLLGGLGCTLLGVGGWWKKRRHAVKA